ncbi:uncharacterized protein LOC131224930 [Magnolia sinica]|uniref:uncharacterized protein LOC131224930 n=1 Tax=Magnolia sinica TaxID=86752 RepID=UPI002658A790|nr:uncharacterized protein LOC131224930 [Magnolia sinica]
MDWGHVDVSSLSIFEASGDSEGGHDLITATEHNISYVGIVAADDAESCTSDSSDICEYQVNDDGNGDEGDHEGDDDYDGGDDQWTNREMGFGGGAVEVGQEEEGVVDSGRRVPLNEMEDKLFWEACLAMGYP